MVTCANSHWIACSRPAIPGFASAGSRYDGKHRLTSLFVAASKRASTTDQDESASTSGVGLQAAWVAAEQFGNVVGLVQKPSKPPRTKSTQPKCTTISREEALAEIRADFEQDYFVSGSGSMRAYDSNCLFADPFASFCGVDRFKKNVGNLGSLTQDVKIDVFKWEEGDDSVKASWRFSAILSLPWKPLLAAAGSTTYHFDKETGLIIKHYEDWDADPSAVLKRLLKPASKMPGNRWEAGMQALHDGDVLGVWQALSQSTLRATGLLVPLLLVVHATRGEGLPGVAGSFFEIGSCFLLAASICTEASKFLSSFGVGKEL